MRSLSVTFQECRKSSRHLTDLSTAEHALMAASTFNACEKCWPSCGLWMNYSSKVSDICSFITFSASLDHTEQETTH